MHNQFLENYDSLFRVYFYNKPKYSQIWQVKHLKKIKSVFFLYEKFFEVSSNSHSIADILVQFFFFFLSFDKHNFILQMFFFFFFFEDIISLFIKSKISN